MSSYSEFFLDFSDAGTMTASTLNILGSTANFEFPKTEQKSF